MLVYVHYYITGQILAICFCRGVSLPLFALQQAIITTFAALCMLIRFVVWYPQRDNQGIKRSM